MELNRVQDIKASGLLHILCHYLQVEVNKEGAKPVKSQPMFSLTSMCAAQLLLEFVSDEHPSMLSCWAAHASDLDKLAADALTATGKSAQFTRVQIQHQVKHLHDTRFESQSPSWIAALSSSFVCVALTILLCAEPRHSYWFQGLHKGPCITS